MSKVLVTGGSGFIGGRAVAQLLTEGHSVHTTVRNLARQDSIHSQLSVAGIDPGERLAVFAADLGADVGWKEAVDGCEYVLHIASPFPSTAPKHEEDLIIPAREGALRVLRASRDAGVSRVVMTSSFAAIGYGHEHRDRPFDETDWTDLDGRAVSPYVKSKTLAERAAWDFIAEDGGGLEFSVVNPGAVFGPLLGHDQSTSIRLIQRLMAGAMPGCPRISFAAVDVRDVVDLHVRAMTNPVAAGERFLAVSGNSMWVIEMAKILKNRLGDAANRVPTREIPNWLVRVVSIFDAEARTITPELGTMKNVTNAKAREMLGWNPRSPEDSIVATAESLLQLGLVPSDG